MSFTALTCTGDRPEAFELCVKYMRRQTLKPLQWIIADDGKAPIEPPPEAIYIRCPELDGPGSLPHKVALVLDSGIIAGDILTFYEDDDAYLPDFYEKIDRRMGNHDAYGESQTIYFNVRTRHWFNNGNFAHGSLCQTAIHRRAWPVLRSVCNMDYYGVDEKFWPIAPNPVVFDPQAAGVPRTSIGIKGMPGRAGYMTFFHQKKFGTFDPDLKKLHELIGEDAASYEKYFVLDK